MKKLLVLLSTAFIVSGCSYTTYEHVSPKSHQGQMCVNQCEYDKQLCYADKDRAEQRLRMDYERDMNYYELCKQRAQDKSKKYCRKPYLEYVQGFNCDKIYDACFKTCGGQIIAVEKKI